MITNEIVNDALFVVVCFIWLRLFIDFFASLAPQPRRRKRGGRWTEDENRGSRHG